MSTNTKYLKMDKALPDIGHVWLPSDQVLRRTKIAQLQNSRLRIKQQILRLDVSMANAL